MVIKKEAGFKYFFMAFFIVVSYLSFLVVKPIIGAILGGVVLGYAFFPVHKLLVKWVRYKHISAAIISLALVLLLFLPIFFFADDLFTEARVGYLLVKQRISRGNIFGIACAPDATSLACQISAPVQKMLADPETNVYLQNAVSLGVTFLLESIQAFLLSIPKIALNLMVTFFVSFYIFIDGKKLVERIRTLLPLKKSHQDHIITRLNNATFAVIYGSIIVAMIQGALGGIGFWIFGVGQPIFWGFVMAVFALVPFIGTATIWLPVSVFMIIVGASEGDTSMLNNGIGLLIWGSLLVGTIDNLLKPKLVGARAGMHPVLVLVGAIGGLAFLGLVGFIVGPLILALFKTLIDIYEAEELKKA